jgi:hypothetical protein
MAVEAAVSHWSEQEGRCVECPPAGMRCDPIRWHVTNSTDYLWVHGLFSKKPKINQGLDHWSARDQMPLTAYGLMEQHNFHTCFSYINITLLLLLFPYFAFGVTPQSHFIAMQRAQTHKPFTASVGHSAKVYRHLFRHTDQDEDLSLIPATTRHVNSRWTGK